MQELTSKWGTTRVDAMRMIDVIASSAEYHYARSKDMNLAIEEAENTERRRVAEGFLLITQAEMAHNIRIREAYSRIAYGLPPFPTPERSQSYDRLIAAAGTRIATGTDG